MRCLGDDDRYDWSERRLYDTVHMINGRSSVRWAVVVGVNDSFVITDKPIALYECIDEDDEPMGELIVMSNGRNKIVYFDASEVNGCLIHVSQIYRTPKGTADLIKINNASVRKFMPVGSLIHGGDSEIGCLMHSFYDGGFDKVIASIMKKHKIADYYIPKGVKWNQDP